MILKAAIIGCGQIAGGYDQIISDRQALTHAGAYRLCPDVTLVGVMDADAGRAREFSKRWGGVKHYTDVTELLKNENPDIVSLCVPTAFHYSVFKTVVAHDVKAIFCEKPLSDNLNEAREMRDISKNLTVTLNYFRRWNQSLANLKAEFDSGKYGKPVKIIARYTKGLKGNGSHLVDLFRWFFGDPKTAELLAVHGRQDSPEDPGIDGRLLYADGSEIYLLHIPSVDYVFVDIDILTDKTRVVLEQRGQDISFYEKVQDPDYSFPIIKPSKRLNTEWNQSLLRAVEETIECIRTGAKPRCTPDDGVKASEICESLLRQIAKEK